MPMGGEMTEHEELIERLKEPVYAVNYLIQCHYELSAPGLLVAVDNIVEAHKNKEGVH